MTYLKNRHYIIFVLAFFIAVLSSASADALDSFNCSVCHQYGWTWDTASGTSCDGAVTMGWSGEAMQQKWCCGNNDANVGGTWVGETYFACKPVQYNSAYKFSCDSSKGACCYHGSSCAYDGVCYSSGEPHIGLKTSGNDKSAWCGGGNVWLDMDEVNPGWPDQCTDYTTCATNMHCADPGFTWTKAGEAGAGEFGSAYGCCGDDSNEYVRTRSGSTDAPTGYSTDSTDSICCSSSTDCVKGLSCTNSGSTSGTVPTRAYCNSGTWVGGDVSLSACNAIAGTVRWNIGGEIAGTVCCGDDYGENQRSRSCTNTCVTSTTDDACCSASTDCVYSGTCYDTGSTLNVGGGSDLDYCNNGNWQDCNIDTQCPSGYTCSSGACTQIPCTINTVTITPNCGSDSKCDTGETISINVEYSGTCNEDHLQIDLSSADNSYTPERNAAV